MNGVNARVATSPTTVTVNGVRQTIEAVGVVYSAVTNDGAIGGGFARIGRSNQQPERNDRDDIALNSANIAGAKITGATRTRDPCRWFAYAVCDSPRAGRSGLPELGGGL